MSRDSGGTKGQIRSSALWGTGNRGGDSRANALWGKSGRGFAAVLTVLFVTAIPLAGGALKTSSGPAPSTSSYIDPVLVAKARNQPNAPTQVIIASSGGVNKAFKAFQAAAAKDSLVDGERMKDTFPFVGSVAVTIKAKKAIALGKTPGLTVTADSKVELAANPTSNHLWAAAEGARPLYNQTEQYRSQTPTIAIVDSGIDKNRVDFDFGARVTGDVVLTTLRPNSPGDGRGHGTFVAGIAAGSAPGQAGVAPQSKLVSIDVMDDSGMARTSDVIAAAEWIYQNRAAKNIRVANFSLHSTVPSNFMKDPLDRAVEKLWFSGVTVVAAAGNYGTPNGPSGVLFAPGNDPFVITVGAVDLDNTVNIRRHDVPSWSAYGSTYDGFRKPELAAAGRYMIGPVPLRATLPLQRPDHMVAPGYMRLSGTSFAAPIVAGAAAQILARHPSWTPDKVKGALMLTARDVPNAPPGSAGVGEVNIQRAATRNTAPNPNLALNRFVVPDPAGGSTPVFNGTAWKSAVQNDASWDTASWTDATWSDASWSSASWSDATWSTASWSDASWSDVTWSDVLAAAAASWSDGADDEAASPTGDYEMTPEEEAAARADPALG